MTPLPQLLARLLPHLPEIMSVHAPDGSFRLVSASMKSVTGWTHADLQGRRPDDLLHPDDLLLARQRYYPAAQAGASVRGRVRCRHRDGHYLWLDFTSAPIFKGSRRERLLTGHIALSRDVSGLLESKRQTDALNHQLMLVQDMAGLAWWTQDLRTGEVRHNEAFVELTGQAGSGLTRRAWWRSLTHPDDWTDLLLLWKRLRHNRDHHWQSGEFRLRCTGGGWRWVRLILSQELPAAPGAGQVLHGVMLDIDASVRGREQSVQWMRKQERRHNHEQSQVAYELHDDVGQALTGLRWQMEYSLAAVRPGGSPVGVSPDLLREWIAQLDETIATLRRMASRIRSPLVALGLREGLQKLAQDFQTRWLHQTRVALDLDARLPDGDDWRVQILLGMVRECLNNVARHARASVVQLGAQLQPDGRVRLVVEDDGVGMATAAGSAAEKMGLTSLRERARQLNAELEIRTEPGQGACISVLAWPQEPPTP